MGTQFDVDKKTRIRVPPLQRIPRWSPCSRTRDAVKYLQCRAKEDVVCGEAGMRTAASFGAITPLLGREAAVALFLCFRAGSFVWNPMVDLVSREMTSKQEAKQIGMQDKESSKQGDKKANCENKSISWPRGEARQRSTVPLIQSF